MREIDIFILLNLPLKDYTHKSINSQRTEQRIIVSFKILLTQTLLVNISSEDVSNIVTVSVCPRDNLRMYGHRKPGAWDTGSLGPELV